MKPTNPDARGYLSYNQIVALSRERVQRAILNSRLFAVGYRPQRRQEKVSLKKGATDETA